MDIKKRIDEILLACFTRASSLNLATGGQVQAESFMEFLKTSGLEGVPLLNAVNAAGCIVVKDGDPVKIPTIGLASLQKAVKGAAPASVVNFTTGDAEISTTEVIYPIDLDYQDYEDAIGRQPGEIGQEAMNEYLDQVTGDLAMAAVARDLQDLLLNGDTASATAFLQTFDGAVKLVQAAGSYYNPGVAQTITEHLRGLLATASANLKAERNALAFYLGSEDFSALWDIWEARGTPLGDQALTMDQSNALKYRGVACVEVDHLPDQKAFLARSNAFWLAFRRNWSVAKQLQPRKRVVEVTITARVGHAEVLDYCVLGNRTAA